MPITLHNPAGLPEVDLYRQVSIATGSRLVFMAGQVARDADGGKVGEGDFAAQVEQCYLNVGTALAEAGASFDDVVKLTVYIVDFTPEFAVLDLNLQDGYGMELVAHLQELRPGIRILILTGYDSIASSLVALKAGVVGYLAKPVRAEQVVAARAGHSVAVLFRVYAKCLEGATATANARIEAMPRNGR